MILLVFKQYYSSIDRNCLNGKQRKSESMEKVLKVMGHKGSEKKYIKNEA